MAAFRTGQLTVSVPATSANLGPGYDCLGLALDLRDTVTGEVVDRGLHVGVTGEGEAEVPRDEQHLVVRAMRAAFSAMGDAQPPGLRLSCDNRIPHSRGLGSSAAAIIGGIVLARALVDGGASLLDDRAALRLANGIEGHPDNVAPALLGGFVVSGQSDGEVWASQAPVDSGVSVVVFVPATGVATEVARGLLPDVVPHRDAAANSGRAALLVAALGSAPAQLWRATEDFLHQSYREPAMPETIALVRRLRHLGVPATVSGAGPSVLAFVGDWSTDRSTDWAGTSQDELVAQCPGGWSVHPLAIDGAGARVED